MAPESESVGPRVPDGAGETATGRDDETAPMADRARQYLTEHVQTGGGKVYARDEDTTASVEFPPGADVRIDSSGDAGGEAHVTVHAEDPTSRTRYGQFSMFLNREQCLAVAEAFTSIAEQTGDGEADVPDDASALSALVGRIRTAAADAE